MAQSITLCNGAITFTLHPRSSTQKGKTTDLLLFEVIQIGDGNRQGVVGDLRSIIEHLLYIAGHSNRTRWWLQRRRWRRTSGHCCQLTAGRFVVQWATCVGRVHRQMHPLLTIRTGHEELRHSLPRQEGVRLRDLNAIWHAEFHNNRCARI